MGVGRQQSREGEICSSRKDLAKCLLTVLEGKVSSVVFYQKQSFVELDWIRDGSQSFDQNAMYLLQV